ncbi:MAG TPA: hypothetical protein VEC12_13235 [Bacteroidia bacterium]|nr:hypothetical protein [Bacteroidia bacterium]
MKGRNAVLFIFTFILITPLAAQVVRFNDTFTLYYPVKPVNGTGTWGTGPNTEGRVFLKGRYKDSLPEGKWMFYDFSGINISVIQNYENGKLNDTFYRFNYDGKVLLKGNYTNNLKTGTWYRYSEVYGKMRETTISYKTIPCMAGKMAPMKIFILKTARQTALIIKKIIKVIR